MRNVLCVATHHNGANQSGPNGDLSMLIRRARKARGLSQYGLAEALASLSGNDAIDRQQVARWERGKRIPGPYWRKWISMALGVPVTKIERAAKRSRDRRRRRIHPGRIEFSLAVFDLVGAPAANAAGAPLLAQNNVIRSPNGPG